ncbi:hypothetical protein LDK17_07105 [Fusobacterium polymorphum]|uniref:hypothetical protein n=1 Tax=Fusobacterium nucleatum subsp. polymorphum TaxID=76857 RepID=UPI0030D2CCD7
MENIGTLNLNNVEVEDTGNLFTTLVNSYEKIIMESILVSFGLDIFIKDQHGGDVDTIHNVREIDKDPEMTYKSQKNKEIYEATPKYDSKIHGTEVRNDKAFITTRNNYKKERELDNSYDEYTGKKFETNSKADLDHVVPIEKIYSDRGRILAGVDTKDLANSKENLKITNSSLNRSKSNLTNEEFIEKRGKSNNLDKETENRMKKLDKIAKKNIDAKLYKEYYKLNFSSPFMRDTFKTSSSLSIKMGMKQVIGLVITEIWFAVKEDFENFSTSNSLKENFFQLKDTIEKTFNRAKEKYKDFIDKFKEGAISGLLSSLTTTICNIFFTTAKNIVKIIRYAYVSIIQALKILFFNPNNLLLGDRIRETLKIISTGASIVVGIISSEAISKILNNFGIIGLTNDILQTFITTFVSSISTCTLLYFIDKNQTMKDMFSFLNKLDPTTIINEQIDYYKKQAEYFERYAAELLEIDYKFLKETAKKYENVAEIIYQIKNQDELNRVLENLFEILGIEKPYKEDSFDEFMKNPDSILIFK